MFEQETEQIIDLARQRTLGNADSIAVKDILAADIPAPLKIFFRADVETMLLDERNQHRKGSRFNFQHPEVISLENQINSILVLNYSFGRTEFINRLTDTVHLLANYLVRPQWTLKSILFESGETVTPHSLLRLVRYFGAYEYLKDILIHYVREKHIDSLAKDEFSTLLWRVDAEYVRRKSGDELARILYPLYEFFDYPKRRAAKILPVKSLVRHFEDKGLTAVLSMLEGAIAQGREEISHHDLGELLENVRRTSGAFEAVMPEADRSIAADESASAPVEQASEPREHPASRPAPPAQPPPSVLRILEINESDRKRFTRKIFRQDDAAFAGATAALERAPSWKEASKIIDEIFIQNVIDPYSSDALKFTETLFKQFHKRT